MTRIIALSNQKGGVGKTTTGIQLARAAQRQGLKVLLVDLDPQGNLTVSIAEEAVDSNAAGLADVLTTQVDTTLEDVLIPTVWENVDLVPTTGEGLDHVRNELTAASLGRETRLRKALATVGERYDLVLIDCPPAIDQLTINALAAADSVLIITHAALWAMDGIQKLLTHVDEIREHLNPELVVAGLVVNHFEKGQINASARKRDLVAGAEELGLKVFEPVVPKRTIIAQTAENGEALDSWKTADVQLLVDIYDRYIAKLTKEA